MILKSKINAYSLNNDERHLCSKTDRIDVDLVYNIHRKKN